MLGLTVPDKLLVAADEVDRIGHHNRAEGVLVARAISSPTFSTKVGVSNGAISLQYIHSRTVGDDRRLKALGQSIPPAEPPAPIIKT